MDKDLHVKVLEFYDSHPKGFINYYGTEIPCSLFHELKDFQFVNNQYIHVSPPIPGMTSEINSAAMNVFGSTYNQFYNEKYKINPWDTTDSSENSDEL